MKDRIDKSTTKTCKALRQNSINGYEVMPLSSDLMYLMEEAAFITATRCSRASLSLVSTDRFTFYKSSPANAILEIIGHVVHIANSSVTLKVDAYAEEMFSENRAIAATGYFHYATNELPLQRTSNDAKEVVTQVSFVGGEKELRTMLNERLAPKTLSRASLYNYLETLKIRKAYYTKKDFDIVMKHLQSLKFVKKSRKRSK
jgi:acyl-CoA hydrolase